VVLKNYFDGGNQVDSPDFSHACIAVVCGTESQWQRFNTAWKKALYRHGADFLHTTDAVSLKNDFSVESGWDKNAVDSLILDCVEVIGKHIEVPTGTPGMRPRKGIYPTTLLIPLSDWLKARRDLPELPNTIAEIFTTEALGFCFKRGRDVGAKHFELYFDQGEPFYGHVSDRYRSSKAKRAMPLLEAIVHLGESNMRVVPALQMADLFAWCVNHNHRVVRQWHIALHNLPWKSLFLDYALLIKPSPKAIDMTRAFGLPRRVSTEKRISKKKFQGDIPEIPIDLIPGKDN
jgi:hypothetical protein